MSSAACSIQSFGAASPAGVPGTRRFLLPWLLPWSRGRQSGAAKTAASGPRRDSGGSVQKLAAQSIPYPSVSQHKIGTKLLAC